MEALQDISWIRYLYTSVQREHFYWQGFRIVTIAVPVSSIRHHERFLFRMLVFEAATITPVVAINIEDDFMGTWCLSLQEGSEVSILSHLDNAPDYALFKTLALDCLAARIKRADAGPAKQRKRKAVSKPERRKSPRPHGAKILPFPDRRIHR